MQTGFLELSCGRIFYRKWGQGTTLAIAVHGFEGSGNDFRHLAAYLPEGYVLIAPDLPWHGHTTWSGEHFQPTHFQALIREICTQFNTANYTAVGFSLGARIWLSMLHQHLPHLISAVFIAPDGLASTWNKPLISNTLIRGNLFPVVFRHTTRLLKISALLTQRGILPKYAHRFLERNLKNKDTMERLWRTLHITKAFPSSFMHVREAINYSKVSMYVILGKRDPLIPYEPIQQFCKTFPNIQVILEDAGHNLLNKPETWACKVFKPA